MVLFWGEADGHLHTVLRAVTEGEGGDLTCLGARINIVKQGQEAGCGESYMGTDNLTLVTGMDLAGREWADQSCLRVCLAYPQPRPTGTKVLPVKKKKKKGA